MRSMPSRPRFDLYDDDLLAGDLDSALAFDGKLAAFDDNAINAPFAVAGTALHRIELLDQRTADLLPKVV